MPNDESLEYAARHLAEDLHSYTAGLAKWNYFLSEATKVLKLEAPNHGNLRLTWLYGRPYFVDFQWVQSEECGYGQHGYVENFGQPDQRFVVKHVAKFTGSESIETRLGTIRLTDENGLQSYHAKCLTVIDDERAKLVVREGAKAEKEIVGPRARKL